MHTNSSYVILFLNLYLHFWIFSCLGYILNEPYSTSNNNETLGTCWYNLAAQKCSGLLMDGVSEKQCCSAGSQGRGWTPSLLTDDLDFFQFVVLGRLIDGCIPCQLSCDEVTCGKGEVCQMIGGVAGCRCRAFCGEREPVCGIDERTYSSECSLFKHNCRLRLNNYIDYHSPCQKSCATVVCQPGKHCIEDQVGKPHCVQCVECEEARTGSEVCSSDGVTYSSSCHLHQHSCLHHLPIVEAYLGSCKDNADCSTIQCELGLTCVTDLTTALPVCIDCLQIQMRACKADTTICASNGVTFSSYCHMMTHACRNHIYLMTNHTGTCLQ